VAAVFPKPTDQRVLFRLAHLCVNRGRTNRGMTERTLNAELMLAR